MCVTGTDRRNKRKNGGMSEGVKGVKECRDGMRWIHEWMIDWLKSRSIMHDAGKHGHAQSHLENDRYMEEFEKAWDELNAMSLGTQGVTKTAAM